MKKYFTSFKHNEGFGNMVIEWSVPISDQVQVQEVEKYIMGIGENDVHFSGVRLLYFHIIE